MKAAKHRNSFIRTEIARLRVRTGDVVVLQCHQSTPHDGLRRLGEAMQKNLPHGVRCCVIVGDVKLSVISKELL